MLVRDGSLASIQRVPSAASIPEFMSLAFLGEPFSPKADSTDTFEQDNQLQEKVHWPHPIEDFYLVTDEDSQSLQIHLDLQVTSVFKDFTKDKYPVDHICFVKRTVVLICSYSKFEMILQRLSEAFTGLKEIFSDGK